MIDLVKPFGKTVALLRQLGFDGKEADALDLLRRRAWFQKPSLFQDSSLPDDSSLPEATEAFGFLRLSDDPESEEALQALYALEKEKEAYKETLIARHTLDGLYEQERMAVKKMLLSFEKTETEFQKEVLMLNPLAIFYKTSFLFFVQDGKNLLYAKAETKYLFIPKSLATGVLRIDDIALGGGLKFLLSLQAYGKPFTIDELIAGNPAADVSLLIDKVKKLMLYQSVVLC